MQSLNLFMHGLLDYAGLFPPEQLPLHQSLKNYSQYHHHSFFSWLGKFILPCSQINNSIDLFNKENYFENVKNNINFSVILTDYTDIKDAQFKIKQNINDIFKFIQLKKNTLSVQSIESPFLQSLRQNFNSSELDDFLFLIKENFSNFPHLENIFLEVPLSSQSELFIKSLHEFNSKNNFNFAVKIRTGGVTAPQIPSAKILSETFQICSNYKVTIKATAGLHVPVPNFNGNVGTTLHGFLNVFSSLMLLYLNKIDTKITETILSQLSYNDFQFNETGLQISEKYFILNSEIKELKEKYIKSFGTCSFIEPIDHLKEHNFIV